MSRINKTQKYAALWLYSQGTDISEIANELKLTDNQIKNAIKELPHKKETEVKNINSNYKNTMITKSESGKYNVAVMTKAASEIHDEASKKYRKQSKADNNIFKPLG